MVNTTFDYEVAQNAILSKDETHLRSVIVSLADHADRRRKVLEAMDPFANPYPVELSDIARGAAAGNVSGVPALQGIARSVWDGLNSINAHIGRRTNP